MVMGALGAIVARAIRLPEASGAMLSGLLLVTAARAGGWEAAPRLGWLRWSLVALLCFGLGAEIDLTRLTRKPASLVTMALAQAVAVAALAGGLGLAAGMGRDGSLLLAAGCLAASPAALIAVATASRSRGDLTQTILCLCPPGLLLAFVLSASSNGSPEALAHLALALGLATLCGLTILMPLSRMATRSAMATVIGAGMALLAGCARLWPEPGLLPLMAILAGFMTGSLLPNRDLVRDVLHDAVAPGSLALFALAGSSFLIESLAAALVLGTLMLAARAAGLLVAAAALRRPAIRMAAAMLPMAGAGVAIVSLRADVAPAATALLAAAFLGEAAGMAATRWALGRSGEAALAAEPDDWRARMR